MLVGAPQVMLHHGQAVLWVRRCLARRGAGQGGGSPWVPIMAPGWSLQPASLQVLGKSAVPLTIAFVIYLLTPLASGSLLSGGRAEGEGEEGWGERELFCTGGGLCFFHLYQRGRKKPQEGIPREEVIPFSSTQQESTSCLQLSAPQASRVMCCLLRPQQHTALTRWVGLKVLTSPLGLWWSSSPTADSCRMGLGWAHVLPSNGEHISFGCWGPAQCCHPYYQSRVRKHQCPHAQRWQSLSKSPCSSYLESVPALWTWRMEGMDWGYPDPLPPSTEPLPTEAAATLVSHGAATSFPTLSHCSAA